MDNKDDVPNSLGSFLTKKGIQNIDIYVKTSISTSKLSQLRNGTLKSIDAEDFVLIAKSADIPIEEMLINTYPTLILNNSKTKIEDSESVEDFFLYIEEKALSKIFKLTGIVVDRLKFIRKGSVKPKAHELYLIELASNAPIGCLFKIKFKNIQLNSPEKQNELREKEREKNRNKKQSHSNSR
ncbi:MULTISPECIES: hypothetical protein [Sphingobacterium]|uniref:hypothetical protein n=1 Tax=Sphingobacterium TaxID=28453 RepID=UPI0013D97EFB|nr:MULTISPECIES: hypothetical protein [unclassified Sphingobacterium]